jgi:hypothetical protein
VFWRLPRYFQSLPSFFLCLVALRLSMPSRTLPFLLSLLVLALFFSVAVHRGFKCALFCLPRFCASLTAAMLQHTQKNKVSLLQNIFLLSFLLLQPSNVEVSAEALCRFGPSPLFLTVSRSAASSFHHKTPPRFHKVVSKRRKQERSKETRQTFISHWQTPAHQSSTVLLISLLVSFF